ncbi:hypothetical protein [Streptomyces acidiscabies]|uniref:hypothetical protein n=1 Tax=Streptomyces acidiscabies TaxID=42234 RepID=UPI0038F78FDC
MTEDDGAGIVASDGAQEEDPVGSQRGDPFLYSERWLLSAAPVPAQARPEWEENGAAWLRPGVLFTAVVIPAGVIHAAVGLHTPQECAEPLGEVLRHGPLFYSPQGFGDEDSYTALLPARVAQLEPLPAVVTHPQDALLLVPAPYATEPVGGGGPWWVLPCDGPSWLCPPELVATLAVLGRDVLSGPEGSRGA